MTRRLNDGVRYAELVREADRQREQVLGDAEAVPVLVPWWREPVLRRLVRPEFVVLAAVMTVLSWSLVFDGPRLAEVISVVHRVGSVVLLVGAVGWSLYGGWLVMRLRAAVPEPVGRYACVLLGAAGGRSSWLVLFPADADADAEAELMVRLPVPLYRAVFAGLPSQVVAELGRVRVHGVERTVVEIGGLRYWAAGALRAAGPELEERVVLG
jgi:hypothetical protein